MNNWIDITVTIQPETMTWPGQPPVRLSKLMSLEKGDMANLTHLSLSVHTGTHMDAPLHFLNGEADITTLPFTAVIGPSRVIEIRDRESIKKEEIEQMNIRKGQRILFKTTNSTNRWDTAPFNHGFVYLSTEAAEYLADVKVACVGIDYPSIAGYQKNEAPVHQVLLKAGIWIIEGLQLQGVEEDTYELICLPLKILGSDGAPARAIIRKL